MQATYVAVLSPVYGTFQERLLHRNFDSFLHPRSSSRLSSLHLVLLSAASEACLKKRRRKRKRRPSLLLVLLLVLQPVDCVCLEE